MRCKFEFRIGKNHHILFEHPKKHSWSHHQHSLVNVTVHFFGSILFYSSWTEPIGFKGFNNTNAKVKPSLILYFAFFDLLWIILIPAIVHPRQLNNSLYVSQITTSSKNTHDWHWLVYISNWIIVLELNLEILRFYISCFFFSVSFIIFFIAFTWLQSINWLLLIIWVILPPK